jgi:hypothetical protein
MDSHDIEEDQGSFEFLKFLCLFHTSDLTVLCNRLDWTGKSTCNYTQFLKR